MKRLFMKGIINFWGDQTDIVARKKMLVKVRPAVFNLRHIRSDSALFAAETEQRSSDPFIEG